VEIARMRAKVGCNWSALPGIEYCLQDVSRLCMLKPFTKEKRLTWRELKHVLDTNYEGAEDIRLMLKNIERYGSG